MEIKLTDGPLKGETIDITDVHIGKGYVKVAERMSLKDLKLNFHGPVVDAVSTYTYLIDKLWCNGMPSGRITIKYEK